MTIILSAWSALSHELGIPRGAASSFFGAWRLRGVLLTVVPSISPLPLVGEMDLSVVSADSSLAFVDLPLAGARFPFLGVTGSGPSVSPFFSPSSVSALALALATIFFFGEARFLGVGVIGSVAAPLVLASTLEAAVAFLVGERFLVG